LRVPAIDIKLGINPTGVRAMRVGAADLGWKAPGLAL
jgi:hypothetical protein